MADADGGLSWEVGPGDSRPIRVLLYLAEGLLGGAVLSLFLSALGSLRPTALDGGPWLSGLLAVFVLLVLSRVVWFYAFVRVAVEQSRDSGESRDATPFRDPAVTAWFRDQQWRWPVAAAVVAASALLALRSGAETETLDDPLLFGTMLLALGCAALAELLTAEGEIDPDSLTLATRRYRERREVDLRTLTSFRRLSVGPFAVCWLTVAPGVENRTAKQGFYAMPTAVVERARSAFEAGLAADPPIDPETAERARFFRRVNRFVAGGFLLFAVGALFGLAWVGGSLWNLFVLGWLVVGGGVFLLRLAV